MEEKLKYNTTIGEQIGYLVKMDQTNLAATTLESDLIELVNIFVSQINGCAFCINAHLKKARKVNTDERKLTFLPVWKEAHLYTEREQMALDLAYKITNIQNYVVTDGYYHRVRTIFSEKEYLELILVINNINFWNRMMLATGNSSITE